jgi:hypothetical protein
MGTPRPAARLRWLLALALCAIVPAALPAPAAARVGAGPPYPEAEWAAWGLSATFNTGAPVVKFAAYVGVSDANPGTPGDQPAVLGHLVENITAQCSIMSATGAPNPALVIDGAGYANFDGTVYMQCATPDWGAMVYELAPHLVVANAGECQCEVGRSPLWAAADLVVHPVAAGTTRANPLLDASGLGMALSMPTSGTATRTRLTRSNGSADSGTWLYDSAGGNRLLSGMNGALAVEIIDYFGGLPYLTSPSWRPYFRSQVNGGRVGQWLEPTNSGTRRPAPVAPFTVRTGEGTVLIGRNGGSGQMFNGRIRELQVDPGCFGV